MEKVRLLLHISTFDETDRNFLKIALSINVFHCGNFFYVLMSCKPNGAIFNQNYFKEGQMISA